MKKARRCGVTVIELLIVLTVIALLLALIIPAVLWARENTRNARCKANLAQLGIALQTFESTHQSFPSAIPPSGRDRLGRPFSDRLYPPHVFLLPFLDQTPLFQKIDMRKRHYYWDSLRGMDAEVAKIATVRVDVFLCPSDPALDSGNNYRACLGPGPYWTKSRASPGGGNGPFTALYTHRAEDFKDGLSNTVGISEKLKSDLDANWDSNTDFWYSGIVDLLGYQPPLDDAVRVCGALSGQPAEYHPFTGATWYLESYAYTWYNHALPPNSAIPDCSVQSRGGANVDPGGGAYKASSYHPGGVNCLFMDGAVRFISDQVDLKVWRALATRDGGEVLDENAY